MQMEAVELMTLLLKAIVLAVLPHQQQRLQVQL